MRTRINRTPEFKLNAVHTAITRHEKGNSYRKISSDLGVKQNTLHRWVHLYRTGKIGELYGTAGLPASLNESDKPPATDKEDPKVTPAFSREAQTLSSKSVEVQVPRKPLELTMPGSKARLLILVLDENGKVQ